MRPRKTPSRNISSSATAIAAWSTSAAYAAHGYLRIYPK
jgi:hypothetical protein